MKLYKYDLKTGEFTGEMEAQKRPNGQDIVDVIGATVQQPPQAGEKQAARWTGEGWDLVEDHRQTRDKGGVIVEGSGTPYWLPGDTWRTQARYVTELGPLPEGALLEAPVQSEEEAMEMASASVRARRDASLASSDYLLMADYPISAEELESVKAYRQALRDLPAQEGFPTDVAWPELPAVLKE